MTIFVILAAAVIFITFNIVTAIALRRVVPTNEVHIVQSSKKTLSFGKDTENGNVYYQWPAWMPGIGVTITVLPVSVFKIELKAYDAYDSGRLPFEVDVVAFFRIKDSNMAAQRVSNFEQLSDQLLYIVRGAVRTVLAAHEIDKIMLERSTFGEAFTHAVETQLAEWGVVPVKNLELMDIRDGQGNQVVHNIMQKKKSFIEMESRTEVAINMKKAQVAEIDNQREVEVQGQLAAQQVGLKNAEREQNVGIASQQAQQKIKEEERATKEKEMAVLQVAQERQATINRNVAVTNAEAIKQTDILQAEANKQTTVLAAEANLETQKRVAEGVELNGKAKALAETALLQAPVTAQITLAKEIGENEGYQKYLITLEQIKANQTVGVENAHALAAADIKVIANTGDANSGIKSVTDLFTPKGGTAIGSALEGLAQTEHGQALISKFLSPTDKPKSNGNGAHA